MYTCMLFNCRCVHCYHCDRGHPVGRGRGHPAFMCQVDYTPGSIEAYLSLRSSM